MHRSESILVVGSINMDLVVHSRRMPAAGQTVLGDRFAATPGGKGANQAVAAARLGGECSLIGRVGDDPFAPALLASLRSAGVNTDGVTVTEGQPSGVAVVLVDAGGDNAIVVVSGANWRVTPDDLFSREAAFAAAAIVVLQLELPCPTVKAAISLARKHGARVVFDPAPARADLPAEMLAVDVLTPNQGESETLTGMSASSLHSAKAVAAELVMRGAGNVVLTLGAAGALVVYGREHIQRVPPYKVDVVDTTAAGDAFTGALAVALARGEPLVEAARFANAAGAIVASRFGAQTAMPIAQEVKMLMDDQPTR